MEKVKIIKGTKQFTKESLLAMTKEELIDKVLALESHNIQLKNVIAKAGSSTLVRTPKGKPFDFANSHKRHILLKFFYLGWDYQGYVTQEDSTNTVEHHLFEALIKTCLIESRESSNYHRCGRTDKGVSSFGQVISIDIRSKFPDDLQTSEISNELNYCKILNRVLPKNIRCISWCSVPSDFSARFDCKQRTYKYFFPKGNLDLQAIAKAAQYLIGTHDFRNFCKMDVGNGVVNFIRNIVAINVEIFEADLKNDCHSICLLTITGQAFLWHQIRCIMGILFLVGESKEEPEVVKELLNIEKHPRKPEYALASEIPLNLFNCTYEKGDWITDPESLTELISSLENIWTLSAVKSSMMKNMLQELLNLQQESKPFNHALYNSVQRKVYMPLLRRQKCETLESRIEHYVKRKRIEVTKEAN